MKIESLNIWGGRLGKPLLTHLKKVREEIDLFCFQEVFDHGRSTRPSQRGSDMNIFEKVQAVLHDHIGFFSAAQDNEEGLAIFIRKAIPIRSVNATFVYRHKNAMKDNDAKTLGRHLQYITFQNADKITTVFNFHGLWNGLGKIDTAERIEQCKNVKKCLDNTAGSKILIGDFNANPDTMSIHLLEENMRNLITEYGIATTRTSLYDKPGRFADYAFVSPDVLVTDFSVHMNTFSDHATLLLTYS